MGSIIMHAPITTDRKTVRNVKMLEQRTKTGGFLFSHVTVFNGVAGFVLYCTSITRRISSGKGNHTNEKLEAKKTNYHLPPFRIGGVNLRGVVDVLPGLSSRLLLVTEVGHEELGQGNVSC